MQKRGFAVAGPMAWNDLPAATRVSIARNSNSSKIVIKTYLFNTVMKWRLGTITEQSIGPREDSWGGADEISVNYITLHRCSKTKIWNRSSLVVVEQFVVGGHSDVHGMCEGLEAPGQLACLTYEGVDDGERGIGRKLQVQPTVQRPGHFLF